MKQYNSMHEAVMDLRKWGFAVNQGIILKPNHAHIYTTQEENAVDYLCKEWDFYVGFGADAPKTSSGKIECLLEEYPHDPDKILGEPIANTDKMAVIPGAKIIKTVPNNTQILKFKGKFLLISPNETPEIYNEEVEKFEKLGTLEPEKRIHLSFSDGSGKPE